MDYATIQSILSAVLLGFLVGMQRTMAHLPQIEKNGTKLFAGSRTFAMFALLGYLSGWLYAAVPIVVVIIVAAVTGMAGVSYYLKAKEAGKAGMTTQIAAVITFLLGLMIYEGLQEYAVFVGVLLVVLLQVKPLLRAWQRKVLQSDINASVMLLAMTFLVLPLLPDRMMGPYALFNPYKTWLMAVIISAISFSGYVAIKVLGGRRGIVTTGAFGGLISSTAVSVSLSKLALLHLHHRHTFAAGIAVACTLMFPRVVFEAFVVDPALTERLIFPYGGATLGGLLFAWLLYRRSESFTLETGNAAFTRNPLQLSEALKFGLLFGLVYGVSSYISEQYGNVGIYVVAALSGVTDVDAITLSLSQLASDGKLQHRPYLYGILIASVVNTLVKSAIVYWVAGRALGNLMVLYVLLTLSSMGAGVALEALLGGM